MGMLIGFLLTFPLFMVAVMVHEVSHGWVALCLGDSTAQREGRLTWNPIKHIDPIGTVALPLVLLFLKAPFVFGWAKPVPIHVPNLRHPKRDMLWVGAAGPVANFLLALAVASLLKAFGSWLPQEVIFLARYMILINLVLGTFNLLPIPPLDGSRVLTGLLPVPLARRFLALERWGMVLILLAFWLGFVDRILWPVVTRLAKVLGV